jgi:hypothetical protein
MTGQVVTKMGFYSSKLAGAFYWQCMKMPNGLEANMWSSVQKVAPAQVMVESTSEVSACCTSMYDLHLGQSFPLARPWL